MDWTPETIAAHVGAPNLHEAFSVMLRTKFEDEGVIASMHDSVKSLSAELAEARQQLAAQALDSAMLDWLEKFMETHEIKIRTWDHDGRRWLGNALLVHRFKGRGGEDETLRAAIAAAMKGE